MKARRKKRQIALLTFVAAPAAAAWHDTALYTTAALASAAFVVAAFHGTTTSESHGLSGHLGFRSLSWKC
jgi:hypothetical protein